VASAATLACSMTSNEVLENAPAVTSSPTSTVTMFSVVAANPLLARGLVAVQPVAMHDGAVPIGTQVARRSPHGHVIAADGRACRTR
jgi:hypothetical protein